MSDNQRHAEQLAPLAVLLTSQAAQNMIGRDLPKSHSS
jgi:hypothetical protein